MTATAPAPTYAPVPIGDLCEFLNGGTPSKANVDFWNGDIPWITSAEINDGEVALPRFKITQDAIDESSTRLVPAGTLLLVIRTGVGKVGIAPYDLTFNQDINAVLPDPKRLHKQYLRRFLESQGDHFDKFSRGATVKGITREHLGRLAIPIPFPDDPRRSLAEQKRIAAILDKADAIRRRRQEAARLADTLMMSGFHHIVGPLAQGYRSWKRGTIESLASPEPGSMRTGPFGSDLRHSEFVSEGVAVLGIDNAVQNRFAWDERRFITHDKYEYLQRYTVRPNDVIVTIMGTTGRSAVVPDDIPLAITTKHLATITVNRKVAEPEFVSHSIYRHPEVLSQIENSHRGAIMPGLNLTLIRRLELPVPPIDVQKGFTEFVNAVRKLEATHAGKQKVADDIFNSLVQRAFRGEL